MARAPGQGPANSHLYHREKNRLVVRDGASLPPRCIRTNQPLGPGAQTKTATIHWTPPWVLLFIVGSPLLVALVALAANKKATITYSLSKKSVAILRQKRLVAYIGIFGGLLSIVAMATREKASPIGVLFGPLLVLGSLVALALINPVKVKKHSNGWFTISGCSRKFLDSL